MSYQGKVVRWYESKGYGFVKCDDFDEDIFVHFTSFGGGNLVEGRSITFDLEDDRGGKKKCGNVSGDAVDSRRPPIRRDSYDRRRDSRDRHDRRDRDRRDSRDRDSRRRRDNSRDRDDRRSRRDSRDRNERRGRDRSYDSRDRRDRR
eukprot:TRINITY_DN4423_c0_g1_i2.p2 TRINITY_DN4423_c0_g1~~TRINITY_DN4423_c0_g1_i2.p2  ORF type:complete len:147 (+),score=26.71 TRINITY_DN4423_c0_g1_i2:100-540(+)